MCIEHNWQGYIYIHFLGGDEVSPLWKEVRGTLCRTQLVPAGCRDCHTQVSPSAKLVAALSPSDGFLVSLWKTYLRKGGKCQDKSKKQNRLEQDKEDHDMRDMTLKKLLMEKPPCTDPSLLHCLTSLWKDWEAWKMGEQKVRGDVCGGKQDCFSEGSAGPCRTNSQWPLAGRKDFTFTTLSESFCYHQGCFCPFKLNCSGSENARTSLFAVNPLQVLLPIPGTNLNDLRDENENYYQQVKPSH